MNAARPEDSQTVGRIAALRRKDMFEAARSLVAGATLVIDSDGIKDWGNVVHPYLPVIVCCVLSIEISLKLIISIDRGDPPRDHNLGRLFDKVSRERQAEILRFQERFTEVDPDQAISLLRQQQDAFVNWRYAYEHKHLETRPAFLHDFAVALSEMSRALIEAEGSTAQKSPT